MFYVEIQFVNKTQTNSYADRQQACGFAHDLLDMFDSADEMWYDDERKTYVVTIEEELA